MKNILKNFPTFLKSKKKVTIVSLITIVVIGLSFLSWTYLINPIFFPSRDDKQKITELLGDIKQDSNTIYSAESFKNYSDRIDTLIKNYNLDNNVLLDLYTIKAVSAYNSENYQVCYESAMRAFEIINRFDIAEIIGDCLVGLNRRDEAVSYYEKAITLITDTDELARLDKGHIEQKIEELKSLTTP